MGETGIAIEAILPFEWQLEPTPSASVTEMRRHGNIALLQALAAIESSSQDHEHDLPDALKKHLDRIESRLDVLLLLVANLVRESAAPPPEKRVSLYADRVIWQEDTQPPQPGEPLLVRLFPSPRLPQPLLLHAVVTESVPSGGASRLVAQLQDHDEVLEEWLTRTIFRHHRRALHARRQP